jgi:hypothetical protein
VRSIKTVIDSLFKPASAAEVIERKKKLTGIEFNEEFKKSGDMIRAYAYCMGKEIDRHMRDVVLKLLIQGGVDGKLDKD